MTARTKGLIAGIVASAAIVAGLALAGLFSTGGGPGPATSFNTGPAAGIPGLGSVSDWRRR